MRRRPCAWLDADIDAPMGYLHQHAGYTPCTTGPAPGDRCIWACAWRWKCVPGVRFAQEMS